MSKKSGNITSEFQTERNALSDRAGLVEADGVPPLPEDVSTRTGSLYGVTGGITRF